MRMLKAKLLELKEREQQEKISQIKGEQMDIAWEARSGPMCSVLIPWLRITGRTMKKETSKR